MTESGTTATEEKSHDAQTREKRTAWLGNGSSRVEGHHAGAIYLEAALIDTDTNGAGYSSTIVQRPRV